MCQDGKERGNGGVSALAHSGTSACTPGLAFRPLHSQPLSAPVALGAWVALIGYVAQPTLDAYGTA